MVYSKEEAYMVEEEFTPTRGTSLDPVPTEVAVANTIIPYSRDDARCRYLGYRACGFSIREALQVITHSKQWLTWCRTDPQFKELEDRIPEFRKELSKEYIEIEFFRNFRYALEKDYRVLKQSLTDEPMPKQDHDYLLKLRSQYTPQQLQILEAIVSGTDGGFNFAKFVAENQELIQFSRTDSITVQRTSDAE